MAEKKSLERVYIIPLRKEYQKSPHYKRAKKAISSIYLFVQRHMKSKDVKIGKFLNLKIWERGIKNPPHHVKVICKKSEDGIVTVELFDAPRETDTKKSKKSPKTESKKSEKEKHKEKPLVKKSKTDKMTESEEKKLAEFESIIEEQKEEKAEIAKEIQKEEIKELKKEHPTFHKPKEETIPKDTHLRKKELIPPAKG